MEPPRVTDRRHWRTEASRRFPQHEEFTSSADEEYAIYNLFFELRGEFEHAVTSSDTARAVKIMEFAGFCLRGEFISDGEDISVAAGVSFFEHLFDDIPEVQWDSVFSCMPQALYRDCRHYLEQWMEPGPFAKVEAYAHRKYA